MDFYVSIAFAVLFELLKKKSFSANVKPALRKLYLNLHAARLSFLTASDLQSLNETETH